MDIHAADKELRVASKSQSGSVSQKRRRRRIEPDVCDRASEDEVGEGGEET